MNDLFEKINNSFLDSNTVLILIHPNPDADCIASAFCMYNYLLKLGKKVDIFSYDKIPKEFNFIPLDNLIIHEIKKEINYDLFLLLDLNTVERSKINIDVPLNKTVIIDHHKIINENYPFFCKAFYIEKDSSSNCELIYRFLNEVNYNISPLEATAMLSGIVLDTENFTTPSTNQNSLKVASKLISKGANEKIIAKNLLKNKKIASLNFIGEIFEELNYCEELKCVWCALNQDILNKYKLSYHEVEGGIKNFLNKISDCNFGVLISDRDDGNIYFSLRTTKENFDVAKIANFFGGGGHKNASGFFIPGKLIKINNNWKISINNN
ncbi:bifunctional oligoribonuclease/PAP phosphatase NrnA [Patescibacteria group bacterium]|nr:bifunctional oligoribonuclease/PAP phosphatase NrnA [Patescibacteria group bacterium]